ncbi:GGDEF domain-containing protein [Pseudoxanthomonas spadix]|uniref:GGDEF domain-containing protein n=1 Tax=Pseudoxanthomonas spadix TaxID=415229 RepID=UPI000EFDD7F2|nr:GGDEF domain-containing protein [Pseudoxanthomonas spadix]MBP3973256.1 GGDEF domain-containing protein [Pseudoxanthomonas spadix]RMW96508.1 GGDEF domain-containing protein [Pseudoxanthomonas spadix]
MRYAGIALVLTLLHLLVAARGGTHADIIGQLLRIGVFASGVCAALQRQRRTRGMGRVLWALLALALLMQVLWAASMLASVLWPAHGLALAIAASVLSALYTIPCMYLITSAFTGREPRLVKALDTGMSVLLAALLILLISTVMGGDTPGDVASVRLAIWHADVIDFSLAILATVRLVGARGLGRRHFYLATSAFLWVNAIAAAIYNRLDMAGQTWWGPVLIDVAFVLVAVLAWRPPPTWLRRYVPSVQAARLIAAFAPVAIALGVLILGISLSRLNFIGGASAVLLAAVLYGLRVAVIQTQHEDKQQLADLSNRQLLRQLGVDPLTAIANRGALDARMRQILASGVSCSLMMIDIDYFKQFNDNHGHVLGDRCLVQVAAALKGALQRSSDLVARYGGEEFAVVLPDASAQETEQMGQRLLAAVQGLHIAHPSSPLGYVTVSIGVAIGRHDWLDEGDAVTALLQAADHALYQAKADGRNRIRHADGDAGQRAPTFDL